MGTPEVVSSELTVGDNRFSLGLLNEKDEPIVGGSVGFTFFKLDGNEATAAGEAQARPIVVTRSYTHQHPDGVVESHKAGTVGVYVANVKFESLGDWGVQVSGKINGKNLEPARTRFLVLERGSSVGVGQQAPRSVQPTLRDVANIQDLDTSDSPDPEMHRLTIAEAVTSGKPTLIVIATPAFCTSRLCGPMKQTVDDLYSRYKAEVNFVHVEPYDLSKARSGQGLTLLPFLETEWGLKTEPWVFVVGKGGNIAAKFEALVSSEEIEAALRESLGRK